MQASGQVVLFVSGGQNRRDKWRRRLLIPGRFRRKGAESTRDDFEHNQADRPDRDDGGVEPQKDCFCVGHDGTDLEPEVGCSEQSSSWVRGSASDPRASATTQNGTTDWTLRS